MRVGWESVLVGVFLGDNSSGVVNISGRPNATTDVTRQNCLTEYNTIACVRSSMLCMLSAVTAIACVVRVIRLHMRHGPLCYHRLLLFYTIFLHCFLGAIDWVYGWTTQGSLVCTYFSSVELLIVCHFYLTLTFRSSMLCVLSAVTAIACVVRVIRLHMRHGPLCYHRLLLFYTIFLHCFLSAIDWVYGWTTQGSLVCTYFSSVELLIVCHFYLTLTFRVMHCSTETAARFSILTLLLLNFFFTFFLVVGIVYATSPWLDCFAAYWLWLASGYVLAAQVMLGAALVLCRRIDAVSVQQCIKQAEKLDLALLLFAFESAAVFGFAYHLTMFLLANRHIGCSGVFHHSQGYYSTVRVTYELLTYLLPVWMCLYVLRANDCLLPSTDPSDDGQNGDRRRLLGDADCVWLLLPVSHDMLNPLLVLAMEYGMVLALNVQLPSSEQTLLNAPFIQNTTAPDSTIIPPPNIRSWRRRYRPLNSQVYSTRRYMDLGRPASRRIQRSRSVSGELGARSPRFLKRTRGGSLIQIVRRSLSAPAFANTTEGRNVPVNDEVRGLAVSSPLDPIPEESAASSLERREERRAAENIA